ncbi:hypothetical protein [Tsukamurella tyrosinosolvens]|uniref:Uncharacterized protein n=1 Tax=Tsukamurella tyrosinosolvens TaxID=57704 RepID=A0A1H4UCU4_TSUTY|nr:hypothetical protein [Tsukamurella tyrosinosolvens]KXO92971.1 hypothetical protein AXK58_13960 [Tsukamurella tyrosinosolvens]SEC66121.1 hypothetical protein SAMN04489793_2845 [Tsukamurella tyrosinosolvens]
MLGSDPIAGLLGAGLDPRSPAVLWTRYLKALNAEGCATTMLGPSVTNTGALTDEDVAKLAALATQYPAGTAMPRETTGKLAGFETVDVLPERITARVGAYFRRVTRAVGKDNFLRLAQTGAVCAGAGIHVGRSRMAAVVVPDAGAMSAWRQWAVETSGDPHEAHTAPTLLLSGMPGGGIYLFRTSAMAPAGEPPAAEPLPAAAFTVGGCTVTSSELVVPVPPTRLAGGTVMRLGPCRMLPSWLEGAIADTAAAAPSALGPGVAAAA